MSRIRDGKAEQNGQSSHDMHHDDVVRRWAQIGVAFSADPTRESPDLEHLLLDTARVLPTNPRLLTLPVTWLATYGRWVARGRLAYLVNAELQHRFAPTMGLMLELAQQLLDETPYRDAIAVCEHRLTQLDPEPQPLFERQRSARLAALAERETSAIGARWRLWCRSIEARDDALRPSRWIIAHNPTYRRRADLQGDLRCSIIETLRHDPDAGKSAMELRRRCGLRSYPPMLRALRQLELAGTVERVAEGTSKRIRLVETVRLVPLPAAG